MTPSLATKINTFAVLGICSILLGAFYIQFFEAELPCPLCLLQRLAMLVVAFGAMLNLRYGVRPRHYAISLISALLGAFISMRQILLHIVPGSGPLGYGSPILGMHLYTWAFIIFAVAILLIGVMMFFDSQFEDIASNRSTEELSLFIKCVFLLVIIIAAANVVTTFLECGIYKCPDDPTFYKEITELFLRTDSQTLV